MGRSLLANENWKTGFVDYLCESVGREHTPALSEAAEQYLNTVATRRTRDTALLKSFEAFREWVTIQAGFYTEHIYPTKPWAQGEIHLVCEYGRNRVSAGL